jgi:hypothetical protein
MDRLLNIRAEIHYNGNYPLARCFAAEYGEFVGASLLAILHYNRANERNIASKLAPTVG